MNSSLLSRLVRRLHTSGKRVYPRNFLKGMFQAEVVAAWRCDRAFRPQLELLEDRLAPTVSFAAQATFATGNDPFGVATGDLNGDGKPDIITNNFSSDSVSVLLNTTPKGATSPTFAAQQTFSAGSEPVYTAVGDVNGDGRPDLAVINLSDGTVSILLNTTPAGATAASFAPQQTFSIGSRPGQVAFADINGDGRPDLVATDQGSNCVTVLMNTTAAGATAVSFTAPQTFATGSNPYGITIGDVNGDGRPDVVTANENDGTISVLLNLTAPGATTASFAVQQTFAVGSEPLGVVLADLNGDGRPDLAVGNDDDGTVSILMNKTSPGATLVSFAAQQTVTVFSDPWALAVGDFNGDGRPDLGVGSSSGGTISVLENTTINGATAASFAAYQTFAANTRPFFLAAADFNSDGRTDLVVTDIDQDTVSVLLNNLPMTANTITFPVEVGDFTHYGVNLFNRTSGSWTQLTPSDPTVLAANDNGYAVGSFGPYGVNLYRPGAGWTVITPSAASTLAIDGVGDIVGTFPGYGVFYYRPATGVWTRLTPSSANQLGLDAYGNVYGTFSGYGIEEYSLATSSWSVLNAQTPTTFAVNSLDQIVANFSGYGVYKYIPYTNWQRLTTSTAASVAINSYGVVIGTFPPYGVNEMAPTAPSWTSITPSNGNLLAIDRYGNAYGTFPPYGTFTHQSLASSWAQQTPTTATLLSIADYPFDLSSPF